jgi:hypothetical protein
MPGALKTKPDYSTLSERENLALAVQPPSPKVGLFIKQYAGSGQIPDCSHTTAATSRRHHKTWRSLYEEDDFGHRSSRLFRTLGCGTNLDTEHLRCFQQPERLQPDKQRQRLQRQPRHRGWMPRGFWWQLHREGQGDRHDLQPGRRHLQARRSRGTRAPNHWNRLVGKRECVGRCQRQPIKRRGPQRCGEHK